LLIFNIWLVCGLISYLRLIYIDKFHEEEELDTGLPSKYNKLIIFITCILGGVLALLWLLWYDLQFLWIDIQYWCGTLYDKVFKKSK